MQRYQKDLLENDINFSMEYQERSNEEHNMLYGHCHSHFEIYVQMSGRRRYFLKNQVYEIETGDVVIIAPGLVHKTSNLGKNNYSRLLIEFDEQYLEDMNAFLGNAGVKSYLSYVYTNGYFIYRNCERMQAVLELCRKALAEFQSDNPLSNMRCRLRVTEMLLDILGDAFATGQTPDEGSRYKISEILAYINQNYSRDISLKETSEKFYLSYYYLSRLFKDVTGFTFVAYVNIVRANKAKGLIEQTDKSVEAISEIVGFGSQKQFVRVFKALYGISPSKYKSMAKKTKDA